jgi:hypothetical protein
MLRSGLAKAWGTILYCLIRRLSGHRARLREAYAVAKLRDRTNPAVAGRAIEPTGWATRRSHLRF